MQVPKRVRDAAPSARSDERSYGFGSIAAETAGRQPCPAKDAIINGGDSSTTTSSDKEIKQVPPNNNKSDNRIAVKRRPPSPGPVAACRSAGKKPKPLEESSTELPAAQNNKPEDCEDKCAQLTVRSKGKDRHSKVKTAKGLRDRRVRLSAPTAIQFFDVQDRLGFDQPSKAVDWLLKKAKEAIDELTLPQQQHLLKAETIQTVEESKDNNEDTTNSTHFDGKIATPKLEKESPAESPVQSPSVKKSEDQKNKTAHTGDQEKDRAGSRAKARERARERASLMKGKDSFAAKAAANTAKEGLNKCKDEHGINGLVADGPNVEVPTKDIKVVATITQAQYSCPPPLLMEQQQQDFSNNNTSAATNSNRDAAPYSELNHHLLLKQQQQAMQASLFSYLLSNAPYDGNTVASQGNNSNNNSRPWREVRPMYNNNGDDSAVALGFQHSKTSLLIPAQGVEGCSTNPRAHCNGNNDIDEREKANHMYSHMLVGHYQADSTIVQTASISPYNQTPTPILPPAPPPHQFGLKNDKMAVQRMTMASNNLNTSSTSSFEQQVSPGHGSAVWSSYNSIGLPYNHPSSSTGGTLQSIFSPAYSSSNSHQQLLVLTTSGGGSGQTPSSSLSSASSGVFNMNMNTSTMSITPSTWVHAGSMADEMQEGAETGLVQLPLHAANSWSHR